jgi:hypothetical protein
MHACRMLVLVSLSPSPQPGRHTSGATPEHEYPGSTLHCAHPTFSVASPTSHCSAPWRTPSPHTERVRMAGLAGLHDDANELDAMARMRYTYPANEGSEPCRYDCIVPAVRVRAVQLYTLVSSPTTLEACTSYAEMVTAFSVPAPTASDHTTGDHSTVRLPSCEPPLASLGAVG